MPRHQLDHEIPTAIHHPEEDMMLLARWTKHALENPVRFWGTIAATVGFLFAVVIFSSVIWSGSSTSSEVWTRLEEVKSPADRVEIAEQYPGAPAATWARLQAATEYYNQGFADLPNNRDVAMPNLKKAITNFDEVVKDAPKDSPQARAAAFGKARALEARNELPEAIAQYERVVKTYPDTVEAAEAKKLAEVLRKPEAAAFYKELYAYSPTKVTLPPLGTQDLNLPLIPAPASLMPEKPAGGGSLPAESNTFAPLLPPPPVTGTPDPLLNPGGAAAKGTKPEAAGPSTSGLPADPFDTPKPKADAPAPAPKAEAPKPKP